MSPVKTIILGAAGRDFHNFNTVYRGDPHTRVVAFTAAQIPNIDGRVYPAALAGRGYPRGIPIVAEEELEALIAREKVERVVFSYSDLSHEQVMHLASRALACGADFVLLGPSRTALPSKAPVISVCATRTGSGKSQTTRRVLELVRARGLKTVVVRHPMPYGDLLRQRVQRFASRDDMRRADCTVEEREEYEPHVDLGAVVYAGVDYGAILREAEKEAEIILWDGGNNDLPMFRPDLHLVVADPLRAGHEMSYHPGEANLRAADVVIINKVDAASADQIDTVWANVRQYNRRARVVLAASPIYIDRPEILRDKRVLVIEDGPTLTHGGMGTGAGFAAARRAGAREVIDPRPMAKGRIAEVFQKYPHTGPVLPAMGYSEKERADMSRTIEASGAEVVVVATPVDLASVIKIKAPVARVWYELQEIGRPTLDDVVGEFLAARAIVPGGRSARRRPSRARRGGAGRKGA